MTRGQSSCCSPSALVRRVHQSGRGRLRRRRLARGEGHPRLFGAVDRLLADLGLHRGRTVPRGPDDRDAPDGVRRVHAGRRRHPPATVPLRQRALPGAGSDHCHHRCGLRGAAARDDRLPGPPAGLRLLRDPNQLGIAISTVCRSRSRCSSPRGAQAALGRVHPVPVARPDGFRIEGEFAGVGGDLAVLPDPLQCHLVFGREADPVVAATLGGLFIFGRAAGSAPGHPEPPGAEPARRRGRGG